MGEQVWVQVWAGPCSPAEAVGCDPEEWGPQKRGYSPSETPLPCRGAFPTFPGLYGEQAGWPLHTSCREALGSSKRGWG